MIQIEDTSLPLHLTLPSMNTTSRESESRKIRYFFRDVHLLIAHPTSGTKAMRSFGWEFRYSLTTPKRSVNALQRSERVAPFWAVWLRPRQCVERLSKQGQQFVSAACCQFKFRNKSHCFLLYLETPTTGAFLVPTHTSAYGKASGVRGEQVERKMCVAVRDWWRHAKWRGCA